MAKAPSSPPRSSNRTGVGRHGWLVHHRSESRRRPRNGSTLPQPDPDSNPGIERTPIHTPSPRCLFTNSPHPSPRQKNRQSTRYSGPVSSMISGRETGDRRPASRSRPRQDARANRFARPIRSKSGCTHDVERACNPNIRRRPRPAPRMNPEFERAEFSHECPKPFDKTNPTLKSKQACIPCDRRDNRNPPDRRSQVGPRALPEARETFDLAGPSMTKRRVRVVGKITRTARRTNSSRSSQEFSKKYVTAIDPSRKTRTNRAQGPF